MDKNYPRDITVVPRIFNITYVILVTPYKGKEGIILYLKLGKLTRRLKINIQVNLQRS